MCEILNDSNHDPAPAVACRQGPETLEQLSGPSPKAATRLWIRHGAPLTAPGGGRPTYDRRMAFRNEHGPRDAGLPAARASCIAHKILVASPGSPPGQKPCFQNCSPILARREHRRTIVVAEGPRDQAKPASVSVFASILESAIQVVSAVTGLEEEPIYLESTVACEYVPGFSNSS